MKFRKRLKPRKREREQKRLRAFKFARANRPSIMGYVRAVHLVLCLLGILLSSYAYYVEQEAERDDFKGAICDIRPGMSCTTALTSRCGLGSFCVCEMIATHLSLLCSFSKGMGIVGSLLGESSPLNFSNSLYGIMLYCVLIVLCKLLSVTVNFV